jgi:serine phosphatase RsbU (regulator of sigma subunit)
VTKPISNVFASIGTVVLTFGCARAADALLLQVVRPPRGTVLLASDVILATVFGVVVYLWLNLRATRTRLTAMERAQIVLDTQLSLAAQIQRDLLPTVPIESNGVRWAGRLEPAYGVAGDFYDFIPTAGAGLFVIGDVSGKGVPAALLQASAHSLFRTLARETIHPADLLTRVSREIYAENAGASYLTCLLLRIDSAAGTLMYANAGHPTGLITGKSGRQLLSRGGPPAGLFCETEYESEVVSLQPGDLGVLVTDGITEAIDEDSVSIDVLNRTICNVAEPRTPERVCEALMEMARRGPGPRGVANWQDDRTVLVFQLDGQGTLHS